MPRPFILIDTDVLIDYSHGVNIAQSQLKSLSHKFNFANSVITQLELMVGCANKAEFQSLQNFLIEFELIQLNNSISIKSVELFEDFRLSHGVMIPDMLIAATAITLNIPLLSKNQRDFKFNGQLDLREYRI